MTDQTGGTPTLEQAGQLDQAALERWFAFDPQTPMALHASRVELDALFLGLRNLLFAQGAGLAAFQAFTHGQTDQASHQFAEAIQKHALALANISQFTSAMMAKAQPDE